MKGEEMLFLLNLLTRVPDNRQLFFTPELAKALVGLMKMGLVRLPPFGVDIKANNQEPDDKQVLQVLLANCLSIIMHFCSFGGTWARLDPELFEYSYAASDREIANTVKQELHRLGILNVIKGYLDHLAAVSVAQGGLQGSQSSFRLLLLNALGSLLAHSHDMRGGIIQAAVLDSVVLCMGWPLAYQGRNE